MKFRYKRLVIWGLKKNIHTHRFIHSGFYSTGKKLGIETVWLDNSKENASSVQKGDFVLSANVAGSELPIKKGVKYVLHNFQGSLDEKLAELDPRDYITLQVYTRGGIRGAEKIGDCTYYNRDARTLIQPWGTPLLEKEFLSPPRICMNHVSIWVGSVWNNSQNQGNEIEYNQLKKALELEDIRLIRARVPEFMSAVLINRSRIAPAVGGRWQVESGYLPCRMFKNIAFGQVGSTNIIDFQEIFGSSMVYSDDMQKLISAELNMTRNERADLVKCQQKKVALHTYKEKIQHMANCFE